MERLSLGPGDRLLVPDDEWFGFLWGVCSHVFASLVISKCFLEPRKPSDDQITNDQ
jgi:hypothetical protein